MKSKYFKSVLDILKKKYGFSFNINDTMQEVEDKLDDVNTFRYITKTNGNHLATNVVDFLKEKQEHDKVQNYKDEIAMNKGETKSYNNYQISFIKFNIANMTSMGSEQSPGSITVGAEISVSDAER